MLEGETVVCLPLRLRKQRVSSYHLSCESAVQQHAGHLLVRASFETAQLSQDSLLRAQGVDTVIQVWLDMA